MSQSITAVETKLREAIEAQNFALAQYLLQEYCREVESVVRGQEGDWQRYLVETPKLLSWARLTTLAGKAHHASELAMVPSVRGYLASNRRSNWTAEL
jgi:hypothetical protein